MRSEAPFLGVSIGFLALGHKVCIRCEVKDVYPTSLGDFSLRSKYFKILIFSVSELVGPAQGSSELSTESF
jgi:hypothetical protein